MKRQLHLASEPPFKRRKPAEEARLSSMPHIPTELRLQILTNVLIPAQPCIPHHVGRCFDIWSCKKYFLHSTIEDQTDPNDPNDPTPPNDPPLLIPAHNILTASKEWGDEALKYFFANNTFVFNTPTDGLTKPLPGNNWSWAQLRDPHATRLLDFVDHPEWKNKGSAIWQMNFLHDQNEEKPNSISFGHDEELDRYRHTIRKMALIYHSHPDRTASPSTGPMGSDWDWVLKVDWETLPHLEELYLDMKGLKDMEAWGPPPNLLVSDTDRMKCLGLKKLVLMNVQVGFLGGDQIQTEIAKLALEDMFGKALGPGGKIEIQLEQEW